MREQSYKDAIKANDPEALVAIIKMIYQRKQTRLAQGKKCTATDAKYFQTAENICRTGSCAWKTKARNLSNNH